MGRFDDIELPDEVEPKKRFKNELDFSDYLVAHLDVLGDNLIGLLK